MLLSGYVPESVDLTAVVTSASTRTDNVRGTAQTVTSDVIGSVDAALRVLRLHPPFLQFCVVRITGSSLCELSSRHVSKVVLSCLVLSCLVLSCLVLSCLVLSCRVLSCLVLSCLVLSCLVLSCLVLSCLVLSCLVLSCLVIVSQPASQPAS